MPEWLIEDSNEPLGNISAHDVPTTTSEKGIESEAKTTTINETAELIVP